MNALIQSQLYNVLILDISFSLSLSTGMQFQQLQRNLFAVTHAIKKLRRN